MAAMENLVFPQWKCRTKESVLNGQIFNGSIGFTAWPADRSQGGGRPIAKINFDKDGHGYVSIMQIIEDIQKSPLGTKMTMSRTKWNPQTKQVSNEWVLTMEKDSEMCYWIAISDCSTGQTCRFPIIASKSILIGAEPPNKAGQSAMGLKIFTNWLRLANQYAPMTASKPTFGNKGGGPRPGGTPESAAVSPSVASDAESMPF